MTTKIDLMEYIRDLDPQWQKAIEHSRTVIGNKFLNDEQLIYLSKNCETELQLNTMIKILYKDSKESPISQNGIDILLNIVSNSSFTLREWIQVIYVFNLWLEENQRSTSFIKMLGFLQCCEQSPTQKNIRQKFSHLFSTMITEHGYVG